MLTTTVNSLSFSAPTSATGSASGARTASTRPQPRPRSRQSSCARLTALPCEYSSIHLSAQSTTSTREPFTNHYPPPATAPTSTSPPIGISTLATSATSPRARGKGRTTSPSCPSFSAPTPTTAATRPSSSGRRAARCRTRGWRLPGTASRGWTASAGPGGTIVLARAC